jgi:hypothetical protein
MIPYFQTDSSPSFRCSPLPFNDCRLKWQHGLYRRTDNSRPMSFTVSAWEWVYATNLSRLQRETKRERERGRNKQTARGRSTQYTNNSDPITTTSDLLLRQIVWLRMLTNLRLADLGLITAQQRSTDQNLPSDLYTRVVRKRRFPMIFHNEKHVYWHWIIHIWKA